MIFKIIIIFLLAMILLGMIGKALFTAGRPRATRRRAEPLKQAADCPSCGRRAGAPSCGCARRNKG